MTEEKNEGSCCTPKASASGCGCGCGKGVKLLIGILLGVFIFLSGMWFAKAHGHCHMGGGNYCPFNSPSTK